MRYVANPVIVDAHKIVSIEENRCTLENDDIFVPSPEMLARIVPVVGDYVVIQQDGYTYLNPAEVFERKYSRLSG